ncbi:zinc finger, CCHC-type containing protein [Tanacetum coccineum]
MKNGAENGAENKSIKTPENEEAVEAPGSQPVAYYLKHKINEKLIKGLVDNNGFNNSLSGTRVGKKKGKTYKHGGLKHVNALVDQGSDMNVMPYTTYMKLTNKRPAETDIRLSQASHSYIYPIGVTEDVLVEVTEHVYPVDFVILDIKENEKRLVLEWEEKIRLHQEKEMEFNQWWSKNFKDKHLALTEVEEELEEDGEVKLYLTRRSLEVLRKFHLTTLGG